jgi:imidazolonepropionase-like amidohydrolase
MSHIRASFLALLACAFLASPAGADTVVVRAGKMLDVERGQYLADRAIRIEDGRIVSVTPWTGVSRGRGRVIDWSAYTVIPGLIDLHTHLVGDISSADVTAPLSSSAAGRRSKPDLRPFATSALIALSLTSRSGMPSMPATSRARACSSRARTSPPRAAAAR